LNAHSVRIRYPQGLRSILDAQLNAQGTRRDSILVGRVTVDSLSFTPGFDLAALLASFSEQSAGTPLSPFEQALKLNVAVQSAQNLNLASSRLSVGGAANVNVVGTMGQPVLLGRISLNSGEIFYLGKRFELQSGTIEFANPARTEPVLNLYVSSKIEQYNVTMRLTGTVDRLRTTYTSDPPISQPDIIHLLAFGNTTAEAASQPTSATQSAEAALAQGVSSPLTGKLQSLTGISQLSIDPLATNAYGDPGAEIAIQERVTGSLLFTFSTNVTTTQNQAASLRYDVNKQLSVTILRDQNGGYGVDVRLHKAF
jgi:translocation and assembly module TamB